MSYFALYLFKAVFYITPIFIFEAFKSYIYKNNSTYQSPLTERLKEYPNEEQNSTAMWESKQSSSLYKHHSSWEFTDHQNRVTETATHFLCADSCDVQNTLMRKRKLKLRDVMQLDPHHKMRKWWSWGFSISSIGLTG